MKCPCGTGKEFESCCQPLIKGDETASTPEQLMRSRYTAFSMKNMSYIQETMDPQVRLEFDMKANEEWAQSSQFLKLEVIQTSQEGNKGQVEFKAWFKTGDGPEQVHHEHAKFRKQAGVWYFKDGRSVTKNAN
jgi:SEC-C motif domain protein